MDYNQPYGAATNAAYVNGNPSTATAGSIPPAGAIEYPQREIVEVIKQANVRGYKDFTATLCAANSNGDLTQLRKAIEGYINAQVQNYIIDAPVSKTVHGTSPDFADLNAAFEWVSQYRITKNGSVAFNIRAGQFTYAATPIVFEHPDGDRITINGATMLAAAPLASNFTCTGSSSGARASDATTNLAMLRTKYATEIKFTGANGLTINGNLGLLDKVLITGDGTAGGAGIVANLNALAKFGAVSIHGFGATGFYQSAGLLGITTCLTASGNTGSGVVFANYANCTPAGGTICAFGNGGNGLGINSGWELDPNSSAGILSCCGNAVYGCFINQGNMFATAGSTFSNNGQNGVVVSYGSASLLSCIITNNVTFGVQALNRAIATITGSTTTGNGTPCSPAANVNGNNNSLIVN
jgi:hypothetical protein